MTTLYIANTSKQFHHFVYRRSEVLGSSPPIEIPPGQQRSLSPHMSQTEVDEIIRQHSRYGLIPSLEAAKVKGFVGLCYSVDKPVTEKSLNIAYDHNAVVMKAVADENRKKTAVAIADNLNKTLSDAHLPAELGRLEVEISEETKVGEQQTFNEGIEVISDNKAPRRRPGRPRHN